jgi:two-component system nitrogen regulation response regulator GlnG
MNKVWIIDDDRSIRWVLEKALEQENIESLSFENGDRVLNSLNREIPDAIISDVRMPGIDGLELLQQIHNVQPDIPVIIMTAHSDLDSAVNS